MKKKKVDSKLQDSAVAITEKFEQILTEHGLDDYKITSFTVTPNSMLAVPNSMFAANTAGANGHWEKICKYVNGVQVCKHVWIPD